MTLNDRPADRAALAEALLDELTTRPSQEWIQRLRRWPGGGVSLVHLHVLMALAIEGPLSMRRIADALDVSEASATGIVGRMVERGLVERRRAADDRRLVVVELSEGGKEAMATVGASRRAFFARLLDELSDDELAGLLTGLRALHRAGEHVREARAEELR